MRVPCCLSLLLAVAGCTGQIAPRDGSCQSDAATCTTPIALKVVTTSLTAGQVDVAYETTLTAAGGTPPYVWTLTAGTLPAGLSLSSSGALSGVPTDAGSAQITVTVSDAEAASATATLPLQITPAPLVITTEPTLPNGANDTPYDVTLVATGGTEPYTWQLTSGALPSGLSLDPATGVVSGTPTSEGSAEVAISVTEATGVTASKTFALTVTADPAPGWTLVWSDEFDGATLDSTKWTNPTMDNSCNGYTEQEVMADDSYLDGSGHLVVRAQSRATGGCGAMHLTAGQISTEGRFSQAYGRFEFRAQMPAGGAGIWPALWLYPIGVSWPPEIDVHEAISDMSTVHMTYHWSPSNQQSAASYTDAALATDYHTYAVEWDPGLITWYIDGIARSTFSGADVTDVPMGILIDIYLGGWAGSVGASFPQYMYVDYVRVYERT